MWVGPRTVSNGGAELTALQLIKHPSPSFGPRRDGLAPQFVVLHYTAMKNAVAALDRLCDPEAEVSAHYLIGRDGTCWQLVEEAERAWHAGQGSWQGLDDLNSRSIGIELDNRGNEPFPEPLMRALEILLKDILQRWSLPPEAVIAHSDLAPGRKWDPGARFDWARLARQGLAAPTPKPMTIDADISAALTDAGYTQNVEESDRIAAFRLRHGAWTVDECGVIAALAAKNRREKVTPTR